MNRQDRLTLLEKKIKAGYRYAIEVKYPGIIDSTRMELGEYVSFHKTVIEASETSAYRSGRTKLVALSDEQWHLSN